MGFGKAKQVAGIHMTMREAISQPMIILPSERTRLGKMAGAVTLPPHCCDCVSIFCLIFLCVPLPLSLYLFLPPSVSLRTHLYLCWYLCLLLDLSPSLCFSLFLSPSFPIPPLHLPPSFCLCQLRTVLGGSLSPPPTPPCIARPTFAQISAGRPSRRTPATSHQASAERHPQGSSPGGSLFGP